MWTQNSAPTPKRPAKRADVEDGDRYELRYVGDDLDRSAAAASPPPGGLERGTFPLEGLPYAGVMRARVGDVELGYDRTGGGEAVLLIMGFATSRLGWLLQVPALEASHEVVTFDNRGIGDSDAPRSPWTMADMAEDARGLLDALDLEWVHLCGISMGGMIAQELALRAPERVRSLTLMATHHGGPGVAPPEPAVLEAFTYPDPGEQLHRLVTHTFGERYREEHPEVVGMAIDFALGSPPALHTVGNQLLAMNGWISEGGAAERLGAIRVPTLVLHGGADELIPIANAGPLAERIPGAELRTWPDAGHALNIEEADAVNEALLAHLELASPRR